MSRHWPISLESSWNAAAPLITDIRTELGKISPPTQFTVGSRPSPLLAFIHREAELLSRHVEITSTLIDNLEQVLIGQSAATPDACDLLKAIASQRMPQLCIKSTSRSQQDLNGWIRDLQQRLTKLPSGSEDSYVFEMGVFCHPEGFLDAALRHLARQQFKSLHSVHFATYDAVRSFMLSVFKLHKDLKLIAFLVPYHWCTASSVANVGGVQFVTQR